MTKIAYFDCFSGISGDMILSALVDAGLNFDVLKAELKKLSIDGYEITQEKTIRKGMSCTRVSVITEAHLESPAKMLGVIEASTLSDEIKQMAGKILQRVFDVEASIHGTSITDGLHLHELSSVDTIIDVVGAVVGIKQLGIDQIYSSPINVGGGMINIQHGLLPVPAPAVCELLKGIPVYSNGIEMELTTPTGAAIISTLAAEFGCLPRMRPESIGYGAGDAELKQQANLLRVIIGNTDHSGYEEDMVTLIETNIDDLNPQIYEYCFEQLFEAGALDVYLTSIQMKKNRPGMMLSVIANSSLTDKLVHIIFKETTSIGLRLSQLHRIKLARKEIEIETGLGKIMAKQVAFDETTRVVPEYESCKQLAKEMGIPLREVYESLLLELGGGQG